MPISTVSIYPFYSITYSTSRLLYGKAGLIIPLGFNPTLSRKEPICNLFCGLSSRRFTHASILLSLLIISSCISYCRDSFDDGEPLFISSLEFEACSGLVFESWKSITYLSNCFRKSNLFKGMTKTS